MKTIKLFFILMLSVTLVAGFGKDSEVSAAGTYTVKYGDTMWKIAVKNQVGISELIEANPQLKNPDVIYPGQSISIPGEDQTAQSYTYEVVKLVNAERAKAGLQPLKENWELSRVARYKSQDMIDKNYFSHTSPTYGSPFQMMKDFGISYQAAGENIAAGQRTPSEVVQAWMNSEGHRKNILSPSYTEIGVGYVKGGSYGHYWTQMFIKK
ncbi:SafA/ExsA family spore coat assembly protein [Rossellomorea oryzaecorticis]|uniref:SafA/ExsA family spore coat assembly protein n=1 Tax=Rossellomorea oryzaecorticis TaxID=1396505 RepID=A0ABW8VNZ8_9BACI|nr:SafA/ExsA family spore coat assembly protein [[Bacillus] enclensis]MBH9965190.1 SafA/ExsA family spore coat assembly protein [[Bacillus] enclensis]QTC42654.1 SafA/ExsA family spore coat assembly protein [Bacillus sp. V3]